MKKRKVILGFLLAAGAIASTTTLTSCEFGKHEVVAQEFTVTFDVNGGSEVAAQTVKNGEKATKPADPTKDGKAFEGWYVDANYEALFDFDNATISANTTVYAKWKDAATVITTAEELIALTQNAEASGKYELGADIDLAGLTLEAPKAVLTGTFDGKGHVIKNGKLETATAKVGLLFAKVEGGTVTDVKFSGCAVSGSSESVAIITGLCEGGNISKIEFNACMAKTTNNYVGLVFARNTVAAEINISEITVKNDTSTSCAQYGGLVMGDMVADTKVNFKNLNIKGELKDSTSNGALIAGRVRGGAVSVENAVISGKVSGTNFLFAGNNKASTLALKNVVVLESNAGLAGSNVTVTAENCYTVSDKASAIGTAVEEAAITNDWLKDTLKLDFAEAWVVEGTSYRLASGSTNARSEGSTVAEVILNTVNTTVRYKKGTAFSTEGLIVSEKFSDGVQLVVASTEYTVDSTAFNKDEAGTYAIVVKSVEDATKTATFNVTVVEQTEVTLDTQFAKLTYVKGAELDLSNLVVYSKWSDDKKEKEAATNYTVDSTAFNKDVAGAYTVAVSMTGFDAINVTVTVVDTKPAVVENTVAICVDAAFTGTAGDKVNGVETFKTITEAIDFLAGCSYEAGVTKLLYVADGTYTEKITVPASLSNLKIIGESRENTKIEYDAVESTVNPLTQQAYTMACATLHVNATGFGLENITVNNTFNYIQDAAKYSSPQGFALTINGDGAVINNVTLYGNQDTLYFKSGRTYIVNSEIDGNVDFIFGENKGLAYFDHCVIKAIARGENLANNGYVTAMKGDTDTATKPTYGYIFDTCEFTNGENVADGSMSLGRPWGKGATVTMLNCSFTKAYSTLGYTSDDKTKSRWFSMSGNKPTDAYFAEYNSTGEGAITTAVDGGKILTAEEAANYTAANLFAATNGGVTWEAAFDYVTALNDLKASVKALNAPVLTKNENTVTWTAVKGATGYEVYVNGTKQEANLAADATSITFDEANATPGTYTYKIVAIANTTYAKNSAASNEVSFTKAAADAVALAAPTGLSVEGATLSWTAVENATGYLVYVDDATEGVAVTATSYELTTAGAHSVKVSATGDNVNYKEGAKSESATVTVQVQVAAPVVSATTKTSTCVDSKDNVVSRNTNYNAITWETVEHAASYDIYLDGTKVATQTTTTYAFDNITTTKAYAVKVVANVAAEETVYLANEATVNLNFSAEETYYFNNPATPVTAGYVYCYEYVTDLTKTTANYSINYDAEKKVECGNLEIDGTSGKVSSRTTRSDSEYHDAQVNKGAVIKITVKAGSTITINNKGNEVKAEGNVAHYNCYTLNGYAPNNSDEAGKDTTFTMYYAEDTVVELKVVGNTSNNSSNVPVENTSMYLHNIIIKDHQEAVNYAMTGITVDSSKVKNEYTTGQDLSTTGLKVTAVYDGFTKVLTKDDYIVTDNKEKTEVGTHTITITSGTFTDTYEVIYAEPSGAPVAHTNTFTPGNMTAANKAAVTTATLGEGNDFLTIPSDNATSKKVVSRQTYLENKNDGLRVTFQGTGTITISFASTGGSGSNADETTYPAALSTVGLRKDAENATFIEATTVGTGATKIVAGATATNQITDPNNSSNKTSKEITWTTAEAGAYYVSGTTYVTLTFTISEAGTYVIDSIADSVGRAARINSIVMVDTY